MSAKIHDYIKPATSPNGTKTADEMPKSYQAWWQKLLPHREDIVVAGREIKGGIVVHPVLASAILGAIVTIGGAMYYNSNAQANATRTELAWQHDQLVRLTTQKEDAEKAAKQEHDDRALQESADRAWREKLSNQMAELRLQKNQRQ